MTLTAEQKNVISKFKRAGLPVRVVCINTFSPDVFQMDIYRKAGQHKDREVFRIWFGTGTEVTVTGISPKRRQLVIVVKEPVREFERSEVVANRDVAGAISRIKSQGGKLKSQTPKGYKKTELVFIEKTSGRKMRYLLGQDERQFFVCEITRGNSVDEAHRYLKPQTVLLSEGKRRLKRQGEWFFVTLSAEEERALAEHLEEHPEDLLHDIPLGRGGTPHVAEDFVDAGGTYVRGRITNPRHRTFKFAEWRKVIRNTEVAGTAASHGIWID